MMHGFIVLEDTQIKFDITTASDATITICDGMNGLETATSCTPEELGALLLLAVAGDELPQLGEAVTLKLYSACKRIQGDMPTMNRAIP